MEYILAPSILSADFKNLGSEMKKTEEEGARYLHFDVMDGMFVPNISFGIPVLASIQGATGQVMDVHLMIREPIRYVEDFRKAGADIITIHLEACQDVHATLRAVREAGLRAGLSICPETDVEKLAPYLREIDMALIMSVHPGFGGQSFLPGTLEKIRRTREMAQEQGLDLDIQVDGGISMSNIRQVLDAGANVIVVGSGVFKGDAKENTKALMEIVKSYE
ncbi:ribulose-phosphate 3-epimerase [uncultured Merdimonas sp.]|uniref:ribulose-phosphate 3-epimerase n=1 Tax=uncultured Merdimonas sp. TaxID=2023269 RepID=UPI003208C5A3